MVVCIPDEFLQSTLYLIRKIECHSFQKRLHGIELDSGIILHPLNRNGMKAAPSLLGRFLQFCDILFPERLLTSAPEAMNVRKVREVQPFLNEVHTVLMRRGLPERRVAHKKNGIRFLEILIETARDWQQLWLDNQGGNLQLDGEFKDGKMILKTDPLLNRDGKIQVDRITWTSYKDGTVRQHWEATTNDGKTWTTVFDGLYKKVP